MSEPAYIKPKVDSREHTTSELEVDMRDVRDRLTKVESTTQKTEEKVDDIHKWAGWFFKTVVGAVVSIIVAGVVGIVI